MRPAIGYSWGTDRADFEAQLPKVALEITRGRARCRLRKVRNAAFLIGAATDCDMVLGDPQFADVHSYLLLSPARVTIRHLGFGPGLSVSGQDVTWAVLRHDDVLCTGPYEFRVQIEWSPSQLALRTLESQAARNAGAPPHVGGSENMDGNRPQGGMSPPPVRLGLHVGVEKDGATHHVIGKHSCSRTAALAAILRRTDRGSQF